MDIKEIDGELQRMIVQLGQSTQQRREESFNISEKTSFKDLVTTVDKDNEKTIDAKLRQLDPGCQIISEEGFGDHVHDLKGHVWIVDPVDGTMNFVQQKRRYAIMIALYVDGQPTLGYILDVANHDLYHAWRGHGAFVNDRQLKQPSDSNLHDSLVAINGGMILSGKAHLRQVGEAARGLRMYGSAGIELTDVITGRLGAYLSWLKPWDLAAGRVIAEELGLVVQNVDGSRPDVLSSNLVLVATRQAAQDIHQLVN
ncbi:inositol monophosphatase family protein [Limosilactobacillus sp.]|uniref:inositol monophosphatase family protein n=1 Tax=Limosilactobacillus sp. TaxID=2773925 RepID=UPI00345E16D7